MTEHNYSQAFTVDLRENAEMECDDLSNYENDVILLRLVKENPCIYDNTKKSFAKDVELEWKNISYQTQFSVDNCKKRYIRLRQYYAKERQRKEMNIDKNSKKRSWPLYNHAAFLDPFIKRKKFFHNVVHEMTNEASEAINKVVEEPHAIVNNDTPGLTVSSNILIEEAVDEANVETNSMLLHEINTTSTNPENFSISLPIENVASLEKENVPSPLCNQNLSKTSVDAEHTQDSLNLTEEAILRSAAENRAIADLLTKHLQNLYKKEKKKYVLKKVMNVLYD